MKGAHCDHMSVGVPPVEQLGNDFMIPPIAGRDSATGYVVRVLSTAENTQVSTNSFGSIVLSRGEFAEYDVTSSSQGHLLSVSLASSTRPILYLLYT